MTIISLPINVGANKDIDEIGLTTHGAALVDAFLDSNGNVVRRPGLLAWVDTLSGAGIDGLYWWDRQECVIAISNGNCYKITDQNGTFSDVTGDTFEVGEKVYFADFGTSLYAANGGRIVEIKSSGTTEYIADADAPTTVSHVAVLDKYLLALESGSERYWWAQVDAPEDWQSNWASASTYPDLLSALGVAQDKIELFGKVSTEGHRNDGVTPFVKESQYTVESGISAPHSAVFFSGRGVWLWLDHQRQIVAMSSGGRSVEPIALTANKYIQGFSSVSDAIGGIAYFDGRPQYILSFPTEDKTLCLDLNGAYWFELGSWNTVTALYNRFKGQHFCLATKWNLSLAGDRSSGKVFKLDSSTYQDDGQIMRSMGRTPMVHHGAPDIRKTALRYMFYCKRDSNQLSADIATLTFKWRDNPGTSWKTERTITLGATGSTDYRKRIGPCGQYYTRQYEWAITDDSPIILVSIQEDMRGA